MQDKLKMLIKKVGGHPIPGPESQGKCYVDLKCKCDFEPFNRASEMWEYFWTLILPTVPAHYKFKDGWKRTRNEFPMSFKGRTPEDVINQADKFLDEVHYSEWSKIDVRSTK